MAGLVSVGRRPLPRYIQPVTGRMASPAPCRCAYARCSSILGINRRRSGGAGRRWVARRQAARATSSTWPSGRVPFGLIGGLSPRHHRLETTASVTPPTARTLPMPYVSGRWPRHLGERGLSAVGAWIGARQYGIKLPAFGDAVAAGPCSPRRRASRQLLQPGVVRPRDRRRPVGRIYERVDESGHRDAMNGVSTGVVEKIDASDISCTSCCGVCWWC